MNKFLLFLIFFLFYSTTLCQVGIGLYTGITFSFRLPNGNNWYPLFAQSNFLTPLSSGSFMINSNFPVSPIDTRAMYGVGALLSNTDVYTSDQKSQKFMQFRLLDICTPNANSARIAWRYNVYNDNKYELGLYSHKNHTGDISLCLTPKINSREAGYTDIRVSKYQLFNYQIIFSKTISAVRIWANVKDQTVMIHRSSSNSTWPGVIKFTQAEASLYATKNNNVPAPTNNLMSAYSSAITVPRYFEPKYYHTNLLLLDCVFGQFESPSLSAKYSIVYPVQNYTYSLSGNNYQPIYPNFSFTPPYCVVLSGSRVKFIAQYYTQLGAGFEVQPGGEFSVKQ